MALDPKEYSAVVKVRKGVCYPDLVNSLALKVLPKEMAEAEKWPTYADFVPCLHGHVAPKFCKNSLCVSCWLVRQRRAALHPMAKDKKYYKQRDPAAATASGAPVAPAAPPELLSKKEQELLTAVAAHRDLEKAAAAVPGWTVPMIQSRAVSSLAFKAALQDLTDQLGVTTRAPDDAGVKWSDDLEKAFSMRLVDCGLVEQVRTEMGISASSYHERLEKSPTFAARIAAAEPLARLTLRDRATKEAASGNDRLLKILEVDEPTSFASMSVDQLNNELQRLLDRFTAQGLLPKAPTSFIYKKTGETIEAADLIPADEFNNDLVGAA